MGVQLDQAVAGLCELMRFNDALHEGEAIPQPVGGNS
jgi:hypothetical protein